ncbi:MAG: hypothetical protein K2X47_17250 [Bdellovibrionales bacterium]|nr:hypothetical protein [Bdellovibrionales bacterium]
MTQRNRFSAFVILATFFINGVFAQNASCNQWDESNRLIGEQKFQAALDNVLAIRNSLEKSGDSLGETQAIIKATQLQIGIHGYETAVRFLKTASWPKNPPEQLLLHVYYAYSLMQYHTIYGWEIAKREKTVSKESVDLKSWTTEDIALEIQRSFDASMVNEQALDTPSPEWYQDYFQKNNYPPGVRPSLRDAVCYMASAFLLNSQFWSPQEKNEIYLININDLFKKNQTTRSAASAKQIHPFLKSISWLADLRAHHLQKNQNEAALEALYVIHQYTHETLTQESDRNLVIQNLKQVQADLKNKTGPARWWAKGQALLAEMIEQTQEPGRLIEARAQAALGQNFDPTGVAGGFCAPILFRIDSKHADLQMMSSDAAGKPSLLVQSKNLSQIFFRAYPFDFEARVLKLHDNGNYLDQEYLAKIKGNEVKPVFEWSESLPSTPDFSYHRKLITPPLKKPGSYWIIASHRQDFRHEDNSVVSLPFTLTNLVLQTVNSKSGSLQIKVMAGDSGEAIRDAQVTLYRYQWGRSAEVAQTTKSDGEGWCSFKQPPPTAGTYWNYFIVARHNGMHALERDNLYFIDTPTDVTTKAALLYTDRPVYRPDQKILWKTAAYSGSSRKGAFATAPAGTTLRIQLIDPNHQVVEEKTAQTNRFGTTSGEFKVPSGRPLGVWRLVSHGTYSGTTAVTVEEYKRPTFEAEFKDPQQELKLNQKAILQGQARYYFGLPVTNGRVKWRVNRTEVVPEWWAWAGYFGRSRNSGIYSNQPQTLASGMASLEADGTFRLEFTPAADMRKAKQPGTSFLFQAEVDITDESGETRSARKSFRIGFVSIEGNILLKEEFFSADEDVSIPISRMTLDGKPSRGAGKYKIHRIKAPAQTPLPAELPRGPENISYLQDASAADNERFGSADDKRRARWENGFSWTNVIASWPDGQEVAAGSLQHEADGTATVSLKRGLPSGFYRLQYSTTDSSGQDFQMSRPFIVADAKPNLPVPLIVTAKKRSYEVGEQAQFLVHTGLKDQAITFEIFRAGQLQSRKLLRGVQSSALIQIPITNEDRGGFTVVASGVRDHQFFRAEASINVPWTDRNLKLEFATFRDKIRPGATETFRIAVNGLNGNRVSVGAAELIATMYDRSLDIFGPHTLANPLHLYPSRIGAVGNNLSLSWQTGHPIYGQYPNGPSTPTLSADALIFHAHYVSELFLFDFF